MIHRIWQFLGLVTLLATALGCTEHVTEEKRVAIGNRLTTTPDAVRGLTWTWKFRVDNGVPGKTYSWQAIYANRQPAGAFDIDSTGEFHFASALADSNKVIGFRIVLSDGEGIVDNYDFAVRVSREGPLRFNIARSLGSYPDYEETVSILLSTGGRSVGRIDCAIAFDSSRLHLISVNKGTAISGDGCNWNLENYELVDFPTAAADSLVILQLSAVGEDQLGGSASGCLNLEDRSEIFKIRLGVDSALGCNGISVPVRFVWTGCRQNAAYSPYGDTAYLPVEVFDVGWNGDLENPSERLTAVDCDSAFGYSFGGECDKFLQDCAPLTEIRNVVFWNGGLTITCVDTIGLPYGLCPWDFFICPDTSGDCREWRQYGVILEYILNGSSAIDDISYPCVRKLDLNGDSQPLTIADMTYIVRMIEGTALPPDQLRPYYSYASFSIVNDTLWIDSPVDVAGIDLLIDPDTASTALNLTELAMSQKYRNAALHVVIEPNSGGNQQFLPAGKHPLLSIADSYVISHVEVSDYNGNLLLARYNKK